MAGELKNVKRKIIINAGHWDSPDTSYIDDPGASYNHVVEAVEVMKIRDELAQVLRDRDYIVEEVPDELTLRQSIDWANTKAPQLNDALAIDIHLNFLSNTAERGSEAFHGTSDVSKKITEILSKKVAEALGIPNRGAKPDTQTAVGSLGWIRLTKMWAILIEVCFISNEEDIKALKAPGGYRKAAVGIADAIDEMFGVDSPTVPENPLEQYATMDLIQELLRRVKNKSL